MMKRIILSLGLLTLMSTTSWAATCSVVSPQLKDNAAATFNAPYVDDGTGSGDCRPTIGEVDGANVTIGAKADSSWSGSGSGSVVAILKAIWAAVTSPVPIGTTGGITPLKLNALTNSAVAIKASAGQLFMLQCGNTNASEYYVQIYNVAAGSVTVGTTAPTLSIPIAATSTGGFALSLQGLQFSTAISAAATTTATGGTAPGTALDCNAGYN